jgi:hypothetical protein
VLLPGRAAYIRGGCANVADYAPVRMAAGLYFSQTIIWVKEHPVLTRKDFMGNHEWCFCTWREGAAHVFLGPNNATDVWSVKKVNPQSMVHLTEKPQNPTSAAGGERYSFVNPFARGCATGACNACRKRYDASHDEPFDHQEAAEKRQAQAERCRLKVWSYDILNPPTPAPVGVVLFPHERTSAAEPVGKGDSDGAFC